MDGTLKRASFNEKSPALSGPISAPPRPIRAFKENGEEIKCQRCGKNVFTCLINNHGNNNVALQCRRCLKIFTVKKNFQWESI